MNAIQYLEFLEQCTRESEDDLAEHIINAQKWGRLRAKQLGDEEISALYSKNATREELIQGPKKMINERIYAPLMNALPKSVSSKVKDVPLGILPIRAVNAHVIKAPNGEPLIILDRGLMHMAFFFMELQAATSEILVKFGAKAAESNLVSGYRFIVQYFGQGGQLSYPFTVQPMAKSVLHKMMQVTLAIETFAITHELAHIYADHLDKAPTKSFNMTSQKEVAEEVSAEFYQMSREHEFEADKLAWEWYQMIYEKIPEISFGLDSVQACVIPLNFFVVVALVEKNLAIPDRFSTHPPALARLRSLIENLSDEGNREILESAKGILQLAQSVPKLESNLNLGLVSEQDPSELAINRELTDKKKEGERLGKLGLISADLGKLDEAINYYKQALEIGRDIGDKQGESSRLGNLGVAYNRLGQTEKAIEYHEKALAIHRKISDLAGEGTDLLNLGLSYSGLGQVERSVDYYEKALEISQKIGDRVTEGRCLGSLGLAYTHLGQIERAIKYQEKALIIQREIGDRKGVAADLTNLGSAYLKLNQPQKAIQYYEAAIVIYRESDYKEDEGRCLVNLGLVYANLDQLSEARNQIEQALVIFETIGSSETERIRHLHALLEKPEYFQMYRRLFGKSGSLRAG